MEAKIKADGQVTWDTPPEAQNWDPKKVKTIIVEFRGHLKSRYKYPISPTDLIEEITISVEEEA